jgi:ATP-binding protein involved in chromosome partitioning
VTTEWLKKKRAACSSTTARTARQDDRVRLLGAAEAGRAGLDAAALGRADLGQVIDPELRRPVTELDMVRDVEIDGGDVAVTIALTSPAARCARASRSRSREHVGAVPGVESVSLDFDVMTPDERQALTTKLRGGRRRADEGDLARPRDARDRGRERQGRRRQVVADREPRRALSQRGSGRVLDADVYGHSIPHMLGIHQKPVVVDKMIVPPVAHDLKLMSIGFFLDDNQPVMWRGPMLHRALEQFLSDVHWGELDVLVVDMPPGTGDVSISLGQLLPRAEASS